MTLRRSSATIAAAAIVAAGIQSLAARQDEYRLRDGNRMEGLVEPKTSGSGSLDLRVASFLSYREPLQLRPGDNLILGFYVPSVDPIEITASEIVAKRYYLMKPRQTRWLRGWQAFSGWPATALIQAEIDVSNLGILGRIDRADAPDHGFLIPVLFHVRGHPSKVSTYELQVVSREILSQVRFSIARERPDRSVFDHTQRKSFFAAGAPITQHLPLGDQPEGWFKLEIEARIKDRFEGPRRIYRFFHQPTVTTKR